MHKDQIHISDAEMDALATTAAAGNFAVEDLVGAAIWAFSEQEEGFKEDYIRATWLEPGASPLVTRPGHQLVEGKLRALAHRFFSIFG